MSKAVLRANATKPLKLRRGKSLRKTNWLAVILIGILAFLCLVPFLMVVSASISDAATLKVNGYTVLPRKIDFSAYISIFRRPEAVLKAYGTTIFITVVGTFFGVLFVAAAGYALSRDNFKQRNAVSLFFYITMLFNGGMVPTYLLVANVLKMTDTVWALIIPSLIPTYYIFLLKMFFNSTPKSLIESAKIDGASEFMIFFRLALPLTTTGIAMVALYVALNKWNEWFSCLLYINSDKILTLQYLLMRLLNNISIIQKYSVASGGLTEGMKVAEETLRMATCVVAVGPMMFAFPFFQKYFIRGITIGAVKE